jgi:hypothetical protein
VLNIYDCIGVSYVIFAGIKYSAGLNSNGCKPHKIGFERHSISSLDGMKDLSLI